MLTLQHRKPLTFRDGCQISSSIKGPNVSVLKRYNKRLPSKIPQIETRYGQLSSILERKHKEYWTKCGILEMVKNWDPETHKFYAYLDPSDYTNPNVKGSRMWIICYQDDTTETRHEIYQLRDKNNTIIRAPHFLSSTHDTDQNIRLWFTESQKIVEEYGIEKILDREPGVKEYFPNFQVGHRFRDLEVFNRNYQNMLIHQYASFESRKTQVEFFCGFRRDRS